MDYAKLAPGFLLPSFDATQLKGVLPHRLLTSRQGLNQDLQIWMDTEARAGLKLYPGLDDT